MRTLLAILAAGLLAHPAGAATAPTIPNCDSQVVAPQAIVLACAYGNLSVEDLQWTDWGAPSATATGTGRVNDCDPYCASGVFRTYPVTVTVSDPKTCLSGRTQYTHLEWGTQAKPPPGQANPGGEMAFPCSWTLHPGLAVSRANGKAVLTGKAWTRGAACPAKVTLTTGGKKIADVPLGATGGFRFAWRAPAGRHVVVARQTCRDATLFEAAVVVR